MINKVVGLYFSPSGDTARLTKRVAEEIAARMDDACIENLSVSYIDLLRNPLMEDCTFDEETIVVMDSGVYRTGAPALC